MQRQIKFGFSRTKTIATFGAILTLYFEGIEADGEFSAWVWCSYGHALDFRQSGGCVANPDILHYHRH
jgi:hypothetical protein